jgi:hypothetical protein
VIGTQDARLPVRHGLTPDWPRRIAGKELLVIDDKHDAESRTARSQELPDDHADPDESPPEQRVPLEAEEITPAEAVIMEGRRRSAQVADEPDTDDGSP